MLKEKDCPKHEFLPNFCVHCGRSKKDFEAVGDNPEPEKKFIDLTPSWSGLVNQLLTIYGVANTESKETIRKEFNKMAAAADKWNEHCKQLKEDLE